MEEALWKVCDWCDLMHRHKKQKLLLLGETQFKTTSHTYTSKRSRKRVLVLFFSFIFEQILVVPTSFFAEMLGFLVNVYWLNYFKKKQIPQTFWPTAQNPRIVAFEDLNHERTYKSSWTPHSSSVPGIWSWLAAEVASQQLAADPRAVYNQRKH